MYPNAASLVEGSLFALEDPYVLISRAEESSSNFPEA
jgi:hypothetical protein